MKRKRSDEEKTRTPSGAAVMRADLTRALYRALFEEWAVTGYQALSLERVAARAGAGKAAIYRRWPSKLAFAEEAMGQVTPPLTRIATTDSLEGDVETYLRHLRRALRHPLVRRILPDLFAEQARGSELGPALEGVAKVRRALGQDILNRAIERGELAANIDREMALDILPAALYWRQIMLNRRLSTPDLKRQVGAVVAALKALD